MFREANEGKVSSLGESSSGQYASFPCCKQWSRPEGSPKPKEKQSQVDRDFHKLRVARTFNFLSFSTYDIVQTQHTSKKAQ